MRRYTNVFMLHTSSALSRVFSEHVIVNCNAFIGLSLQVLTFLFFFLKKKLQSAIFNFQKKNVFSFLADTRRKNLLSTIYIKHFYHRSKVTEHRERKENPPDIPEFAVFSSCQARQSDLSSQFFTATRE